MIRRAAFALALACTAPAVQATPPDVIQVQDELFGVSDTHVFVLRSGLDNLGLHNSDMRNLALVAIDRQTTEEQIWPVWRSHRLPDYDRDPDGLRMRTDLLALPDAVDPFAKLAELGAYPFFGKSPFASADLRMAPNIGSNLEAVSGFTLDDGTRFNPDPVALQESLGPALDRFAQAMGDYPRFGPLSAGDLLMGRDFADMRCSYPGRLLLPGNGDAPPTHLILVTCPSPMLGATDPDADANPAALWRVVPPEPRD